jgi:hypothetical protein
VLVIESLHFVFVFMIRRIMEKLKEVQQSQSKRASSVIREIKHIVEKVPEGILIMPENDEDLLSACYMNQELKSVLEEIGIEGISCCSGIDMDEGIALKIFRRYCQKDETGAPTPQVQSNIRKHYEAPAAIVNNLERSNYNNEELISIQ